MPRSFQSLRSSRFPVPCVESLEPRRLLSDGTLDTTFATSGLATTDIAGDDRGRAVIVQPDGKIVAMALSIGDVPAVSMARFNTDGTLDSAFGSNGKVTASFGIGFNPRGEAIQDDGGIVVCGSSNGHFALIRFDSTGALDYSFGTGGEALLDPPGGSTAYGVVVLPNQQIVAGGEAAIVKLNSNGLVDQTFGVGGFVQTGFGPIKALALEPVAPDVEDILIAGQDASGGVIARYTPDGAFDPTFFGFANFQAPYSAGEFRSVLVTPGNQIIAGGHVHNSDTGKEDMVVARFGSDAVNDSTFGINGVAIATIASAGHNDIINSVAVQADGKIIAGGSTDSGTAGIQFVVLRFNNDGTLDSTFASAGIAITPLPGTAPERCRAIATEPEGKIIAVGFANGDMVVGRYDSAFATVANGTLRVSGTTGADTISVTTDGTNVNATLNGEVLTFAASDVRRILLIGSYGNDSMSVGPGIRSTEFHGGRGTDTITGGDGNDTIFGGRGNDSITCGAGDDSVFAGRGDDTVQGNSGNDTIFGAVGNDLLQGGQGNDLLLADDGFGDIVEGGADFDTAQTDLLDTASDVENINPPV